MYSHVHVLIGTPILASWTLRRRDRRDYSARSRAISAVTRTSGAAPSAGFVRLLTGDDERRRDEKPRQQADEEARRSSPGRHTDELAGEHVLAHHRMDLQTRSQDDQL